MRKVIHVAVLVIGILPALWAAGVVGLAIRARGYLGYWPSLYHPDPQVLPFDFHDSVLFFSGYLVFWTLPAMPVLYLSLRDRLDSILWSRAKTAFTGGWITILVLALVPPINFIVWYLD